MIDEKMNNPEANPVDPAGPGETSENKSISPEAEAVAANQPVPLSADSSAAPDLEKAKQELDQSLAQARDAQVSAGGSVTPPQPKEPSVPTPSFTPKTFQSAAPQPPKKIGKETTKRKSNAKFLVIMGLVFAALFVTFIVLMVLMIATGGAESPVLAALNLDAAGIKSFLITVVNLSFGFLGFLFFILAVIGVFRLLFAKKADKEARGKGVRMTLVGILPLIFIMFIWLFLYNFIQNIQIAAERVKAEILILEPVKLEGLQAPLTVTFSSEHVIKALQNQGYQIQAARWDFEGDGTFETEATGFDISYLYNLRGNYNVGLQVAVAGEDEPKIFNYPLVIGEAVFDAKPATGTAPLQVQFDAQTLIPKGTKIQSMDWDFNGDGEYELTGKDNLRPRYTFEQIGLFKVHLRIVDEQNLVENYYREIEIIPGDRPLLVSEIEATPALSGVIPLQIRFDGSKSESVKGSIVNYEWDFGDGSQIQVGRSVSHVYQNPGFYTVTLTIREDSGKEASATVEVEAKGVSSVPEARINTTPSSSAEGILSGEIPFNVSFDGSASLDPDKDIVEYEWDFGMEGAKQVGQKVDFTFEKEGTYLVRLNVRDSEAQEGSATLTVNVTEPGVRAVINADPAEGTAPLTVAFDGSTSTTFNGKIVSYEWDFGDGSPKSITGAALSHKYTQVGTYTVKLKVVTNQNESAMTEKLVYVREIPLKACFTPSRRNGAAPLAVTFDAKCSTGAVANFKWNFGDGETSDDRKPSHTFENPGTYNVTLEVSDDKNNVDSFSDVIVAEGTIE